MRYIRVEWLHEFPDEPIVLYSELDDRSMEARKVELFRDGSSGFADAVENWGSTHLGLEPVPPLEEVALDPQFRPRAITRADFERVWEAAQAVGRAKSSIG